MHCLVLLLLLVWLCSQFTAVAPLCFLPPPLMVMCSNPKHPVHQSQDNELRVSCFWDGDIKLKYSQAPGLISEKEGEKTDLQPAPHCRWYQDSVVVRNTNHWSGELVMGTRQNNEEPHSSLAFAQITVQCESTSVHAPACVHKNVSIEMSGQDVHLFLLSPHTLPIWEWQPVQLGWCARLKSSTWSYHFKSPGGRPAEFLIPSENHSEPPMPTAYPHAELRQVCALYYNYHVIVHYPHHGFYRASLYTENGPQLNQSLGLQVESALLHVFSVSSKRLSLPHQALSLSWTLQPLSSGIMAYTLMGVQALAEWFQSYSYNPFALQSHFCAAPNPQNSREKVLASIYFRTNEILSGGLMGKLNFSNETLVFTTNHTSPIYLMLNPQKIKMGTYIFSPALGLHYLSQEGRAANTTGENSSSHYVFYQQQSLSYLIVVEFVQQRYRFSLHVYLNRREALFRALGEKGIEVHIFIGHSPDNNLVYIVWFIPVQHPLLQCEWAFSLQLFDSRKEYLLWSHSYTYKDNVRNASRFFSRSVLPFQPALYTGFVAEVNCRKTGLTWAVLKATVNTFASKVMEPAVACQKSYCHEVRALIHKPAPSNPIIHWRRKSKISLQATAKAVCRTGTDLEILWKIYKLQTIRNPPNWSNALKISSKIRQGGVTFHIPAYYLVAGLYLINMTMTVHLPAYNIKIRESDSVFLQILEDDLVANIAGGYFQTVGVSDRWALDGSASFDPDSADPHEGIQFHWYCTMREMDYVTMQMSSDEKCHPAQTSVLWPVSNDPVQIMAPHTLRENTKYYIVLIIRKKAKTAHTYQIVHVVPGSAPVLRVTCFENCGKAVKATERLVLSGKCLNCEKAYPTAYFWTLLSTNSNEICFDWASKTTTGRSNPSIHINPLAFEYETDTFYTLSLKASTQGKRPSIYRYSFYVQAPPRIGKCIIYPRVGTAFHTKFIIHCSGFENKNPPLTYKVIAHSNLMKMAKISSIQKNTFGTIVYVGHQHKTPPSFLPVGMPSKNYVLVIYVQVHDVNGVFSQVILQATVHPPSKRKPVHIILHELHGLISGPKAPMSIFLKTKDYLNLGYFVHMVASVLNNIETTPTIHGPMADMWRILLNLSAELPMIEAELISQVVSSICQITQGVNAINSDSQLLAVKKLKEATEALKMHRNKGLSSKETEILVSGILTGLSNVLRGTLLYNGNVHVNVVKEIISVTEILADLVLQGKVPGEQETNMEVEGWNVHLWKNEKWDISGPFSERQNCKNCLYAKLNQDMDLMADVVVSTVLHVFEKNPFPWLTDTTDIRTAVTGFKMASTNTNGDTIGITPEVIEMIMDRKDKDSATFGLTLGPDKTFSKTTGGFSFEINPGSKDILIQILCDKKVNFDVSVYFGQNVSSPPIASYIAFFDKLPIPRDVESNIPDCTFKAPYILCLPQSLLQSPLQGSKEDKWNISVVLHAYPIVRSQTPKMIRIALFTANCLDLDEVQNQWKEGTCHLGSQTSWSKIHCICIMRERSTRATSPESPRSDVQFLAGKIIVYPNPLDFTKILLAEFDTNPVPLVTVFFIFTGYIFCVIWAVNKDKSDLKRKNKILVLPDNDPFHNVRYLITVYTGSRLGSGTTADVFIELTGVNGTSDVHCLKQPRFQTFFRAAVDTFLLTTEIDLGNIVSIHIWHNNGGSSPDWYLSRIKVYNAQTKQSWLFICRSWFGLGRGDCKIERTFEPSNQDAPLHKADYFMIKLAKDLEENHEWLSIFAKVVTGPFTRVQRLSCCLTILLCNLLLNIMFFSNKEEIAPLRLRYMQSFYIGVVSALVTIPLQVGITWGFKYSKKIQDQDPDSDKTKSKRNASFLSETLEKENAEDPQTTSEEKNQDLSAECKDTEEDNILNKVFMLFLKTPTFPWWCQYISWFLVFTVSALASVVIVLYGLTYGYTTSIEWFIASVTSFCESVFLLQTLKMVIFSAMSTINLKYCEKIPWITAQQYQGMQLVKISMDDKDLRKAHRELVKCRRTREYQPMKEDEVIILRKKVRAQHLAFVFVKDIVCHFVFSSCVFSIVSEMETTTAFYYNQAMYQKFSPGLSSVNQLEHIYVWANDIFVPLIHCDYKPTYLAETWSKILGSPRMRQIRAKNTTKTCFSPQSHLNNPMVSQVHCHHQYAIDPEDEANYLGSWAAPTTDSSSKHTSSFQGFTYESDIDQWEYKSYGVLNTYVTGGYSFYFFPHEQRQNTTLRLDDLQRNKWLDERTWAVIFELTVFNPDVDLYCSITVIFEFSDIGVVNTSLSVHSYALSTWSYQTGLQLFVFGLLVYILVFYLADEFLLLRQERLSYLQTATNVQNLAIKSMSFMFILLIPLKFHLAKTLLTSHLLHPEIFVPFHVVSQIDQLHRVVSGLLGFLLVLKPYRYFRFLYKVRLAEKTLAAVLPIFVNLSMTAVLLFFIYMLFGYLIFGQNYWDYNTFIHAFQSVVSYCFSAHKPMGFLSNWWLEMFFQVSLFFSLMVLFANLWRSALICTYVTMKQPVYEQHSDEAEAINFVALKIQSIWFLITNHPPTTIDHHPFSNVIFGKPIRTEEQHQGLQTRQIEGQKKETYLVI